MTNCFTRTEKQEEKTNGEIQETFFSIREQKIKKDAAGNGYLSDETIANRASDALLNYMEACYEKNGNLDAKAQSYWRAFRERAHPDTDYNKTIAATVMSEEPHRHAGSDRQDLLREEDEPRPKAHRARGGDALHGQEG